MLLLSDAKTVQLLRRNTSVSILMVAKSPYKCAKNTEVLTNYKHY